MKLEIVCVYNDEKCLNSWLVDSLHMQNYTDYTLKLIDNTEGKEKDLCKIYNSVMVESSAEYLLFVHQDFRFLSENSLQDAVNTITQEKLKYIDVAIIGVAGALSGHDVEGVSSIIHGTGGQNVSWE